MPLWLLLTILVVQLQACLDPQRLLSLSHRAASEAGYVEASLSKASINPLNAIFTEGQRNFQLKDIKPKFLYNSHLERETTTNETTATVELGELKVVLSGMYQISENSTVSKGEVFFTTQTKGGQFQRTVVSNKIQITQVQSLGLYKTLRLESSDPKLQFLDFESISNWINQSQTFLSTLISNLNAAFMAATANFPPKITDLSQAVTYGNSIQLLYEAQLMKMSYDNYGLQVAYDMTIKNPSTEQRCGKVPSSSQGSRQTIALQFVETTITELITKGLLRVKLGTNWDSPGFQFYLGDLGGTFDYSRSLEAGIQLKGKCSETVSIIPKLSIFSESELYWSFGVDCTISAAEKDLFGAAVRLYLTIKVETTEKGCINGFVNKVGLISSTINPIDSKFQVTNELFGSYTIQSVSRMLVGTVIVRGSCGWIMNQRSFPAIRLDNDSRTIVVFDPSLQV